MLTAVLVRLGVLVLPFGVINGPSPATDEFKCWVRAFGDHRSITLATKANLGPTHTAIVSHVLARG